MKISTLLCAQIVTLTLASQLSPCLSAAEYDGGVKARLISQTGVTGNGARIKYPVLDEAVVSALEVEIAKGAQTGWHRHPVPVYAYVLGGTLQVELEDGKALTFKRGDAIVEVVDAWHNGRNVGCEPVRLAVFYTGGKGVPNVEKSPKDLGTKLAASPQNCPAPE